MKKLVSGLMLFVSSLPSLSYSQQDDTGRFLQAEKHCTIGRNYKGTPTLSCLEQDAWVGRFDDGHLKLELSYGDRLSAFHVDVIEDEEILNDILTRFMSISRTCLSFEECAKHNTFSSFLAVIEDCSHPLRVWKLSHFLDLPEARIPMTELGTAVVCFSNRGSGAVLDMGLSPNYSGRRNKPLSDSEPDYLRFFEFGQFLF